MKKLFLNAGNGIHFLKSAGTALFITTLVLTGCKKDHDHPNYPGKPGHVQATVVKGSDDISTQLAQFRLILGDSLNTGLPGNPEGRREINWDGVPATASDNNPFPFDFFNSKDPGVAAGRKRGLEYVQTDNSLRVSTKAFADVEPSYGTQFSAFSNPRTFARLGSNTSDVTFRVPGTSNPATVKGLGVIFIDVDDAHSTYMEFFKGNKSLGKYYAPVRSGNTSFSFLGVYFPDEAVTHVKITSGNGPLATGSKDISNGGSKDIVIMDDFFYNEPKPVQ
jgi:hypothetical protein